MKRLWNWFQTLSRFNQIGLSVLAVHAIAIFSLCIDHLARPSVKKKQPIAIRTVSAPKPPAPIARAPAKASPYKAAPPPAAAKKAAPKAQAKPAQQAKTNGQGKKKEAEAIDPGLLQQIAESLGAIAATTKVSRPNLTVALPEHVDLGKDADPERPGYGETVSAILKESLDLPEYGEVVARIEIDAKGNVSRCDILETKSRKNAEFLKKRLQELAFPCFNEFGLAENRLDFTVTFHNVETR